MERLVEAGYRDVGPFPCGHWGSSLHKCIIYRSYYCQQMWGHITKGAQKLSLSVSVVQFVLYISPYMSANHGVTLFLCLEEGNAKTPFLLWLKTFICNYCKSKKGRSTWKIIGSLISRQSPCNKLLESTQSQTICCSYLPVHYYMVTGWFPMTPCPPHQQASIAMSASVIPINKMK